MIARIARRLRIAGRSQAGMSLAELLVAMFITGILMTLVGTMFVNIARVTTNSNASTSRSGIAGNVMDEISKVVRTATNNPVTGGTSDPAIVSGTTAALTLYSYVDADPLNPAPTKVTFRVDAAGTLFEDRITATASGSYWVFTGTAKTRNLGGVVQTLTGTDALFIYYDDTNTVITPGGTGLTLAQRALVASVQVTVRVTNTLTTGADPIILINTVGMPNLFFSRTDN